MIVKKLAQQAAAKMHEPAIALDGLLFSLQKEVVRAQLFHGCAPSRAHAAMNRQSTIIAPSSAQKNMSMSARTPRGGAPGNALRTAGSAKIMAPRAPISVTSILRIPRKTR